MSEDNYMQAQAISTTFGYQEEDETPSNNGRAYATIKSNNKWKRKLGIWISKHLSKKQFKTVAIQHKRTIQEIYLKAKYQRV